MSVIEILDADFKETVSNGVVVVDFWAPWCAPCRMIAPILEELQSDLGKKAKITKLNVDENPNAAGEFGVTSIPTLLIFKDGKMVDRMVGAGPKEHYKGLIDKHLSKD